MILPWWFSIDKLFFIEYEGHSYAITAHNADDAYRQMRHAVYMQVHGEENQRIYDGVVRRSLQMLDPPMPQHFYTGPSITGMLEAADYNPERKWMGQPRPLEIGKPRFVPPHFNPVGTF